MHYNNYLYKKNYIAIKCKNYRSIVHFVQNSNRKFVKNGSNILCDEISHFSIGQLIVLYDI